MNISGSTALSASEVTRGAGKLFSMPAFPFFSTNRKYSGLYYRMTCNNSAGTLHESGDIPGLASLRPRLLGKCDGETAIYRTKKVAYHVLCSGGAGLIS